MTEGTEALAFLHLQVPVTSVLSPPAEWTAILWVWIQEISYRGDTNSDNASIWEKVSIVLPLGKGRRNQLCVYKWSLGQRLEAPQSPKTWVSPPSQPQGKLLWLDHLLSEGPRDIRWKYNLCPAISHPYICTGLASLAQGGPARSNWGIPEHICLSPSPSVKMLSQLSVLHVCPPRHPLWRCWVSSFEAKHLWQVLSCTSFLTLKFLHFFLRGSGPAGTFFLFWTCSSCPAGQFPFLTVFFLTSPHTLSLFPILLCLSPFSVVLLISTIQIVQLPTLPFMTLAPLFTVLVGGIVVIPKCLFFFN